MKVMKKYILLLLILLPGIFISAHAKKVEMRDAKIAGTNFYYHRINLHQNIPFRSLAITGEFTEKANGTPMYYIFNFNNKGFIIMAADDAVFPVIGYSFETSYTKENPSPEFTFWMEHYKDQVRDAIERGLQPNAEIIAAWAQLSQSDTTQLPDLIYFRGSEQQEFNSDDPTPTPLPFGGRGRGRSYKALKVLDVQPLLTDTWNQVGPYNAMCPEDPAGSGNHVLVGCVATAMSMIMHYWRYPATGQGSHCISPEPSYGPQCADFGSTTYDWNGMTHSPSETCDPVALLSWHTGISLDMHYGLDVSTAQYYKVKPALINYFKYASTIQYLLKINYSTTSWNDLLKVDLDAGMPIEYGGNGTSSIGHAWVCDGYQGPDFFHMNWGWGGSFNGYFYLNDLNPGGNNFNNNQNATVHIQPDPAYYPAYCAGQVADTVYAFGSIEDGSGPVANYEANSSCSWLFGLDDSVQSVNLTFLRFSTDPADEVKIYDGSTTSSPLLGTFSGSSIPPEISSTGNRMLVTFASGSSISAPGFLAEYNSTFIPFCSGTTILSEPSGDFGDGSGRYMYRNSTTCKWKIMPENAESVTLTFNHFKTEQDKDFVQIFDIGSNTLLATYSGDYASPPGPVTAPSGKMSVIFNTNGSVRDAGWDASYSITVGTNNQKVLKELIIYPNPADQSITLEVPGLSGNPAGSVIVYGTAGQEVIHQAIDNVKVEIDVSSLPRGIYFIRFMNDEKTESGKFIKE
jgi:hypothetical protein